MTERTIITQFSDRNEFKNLIENHEGVVIVKFGAEWCAPCKAIKDYVHEKYSKLPDNIIVAELDIDEDGNDDVFTYLKSPKLPSFFSFVNGDKMDIYIGTNRSELDAFFSKCEAHDGAF